MTQTGIPIGSVVAYAGQLTGPQLNRLGWAICDGARLPINRHKELFDAIRSTSGGDTITYFNLPDYRGYFLRGTDPDGKLDPEAGSRQNAHSGGLSGPNVGTVQSWATGYPNEPCYVVMLYVPATSHYAYASSGVSMLLAGSQRCYSGGGGDAETRPANAYVHFIIKLTADAQLPVAAVIPFAGPQHPSLAKHYLLCNGALLARSEHSELFQALASAHGGTAQGFNLPDYRGLFLRGAAGDSTVDPDRDSRTAMQQGGSTGNRIGSRQGYATARPHEPFYFDVNIGTVRADSSAVAGHANTAWSADSQYYDIINYGGDVETRPANASVDFQILAQNPDGDVFPIGGIIGFPGNVVPPADQWLLCNGAALSIDRQFQPLFEVIGHSHGGDHETFNLPDYQGRFLRGCSHGSKQDPEAAERLPAHPGGQAGDAVGSIQGWATAPGGSGLSAPITALVHNYPTSSSSNAAALGGNDVAAWNDDQETVIRVSGGDKETRPANVYINFYIRYAA